MRMVVALAVLVACGDNLSGPPLASSDQVIIVAHQDDEHLFMQPDLTDALLAHTPTTIVYVTAGDGGNGVAFSDSRIGGSKAAYSVLLGSQAWTCGWIEIAEHWAQSCRFGGAPLSLIFLGYPDGGVSGQLPNSLLSLWEGTEDHVDTIADTVTTYTRGQLIATVAKIIETTNPAIVRTLEIAATHSDDHSDHMFVGALAMQATMKSGTGAHLISYRGYNINYEAPTSDDQMYDYASLPMRSYEACLLSCDGGACGVTPCSTLSDPRYTNFLHRRYAVAMRESPQSGVLHANGQCLVIGSSGMALGDCATAPVVQLQPGGLVAIAGQCLEAAGDGSLILGPCVRTPERTFMFDDEGHLFINELPVPQPNLDTMHDLCVVGDADGLRVDICGSARDARWDLVQPTVSTPRSHANCGKGRSVRMADLNGDGLADLCFVDPTLGLSCSFGDGTGHFAPTVPLGATSFIVQPESLALGDIDGDGRADACGRTALGIVCATAASGFVGQSWSTGFASTGPTASSSDHSLAIIRGAVCGMSSAGMICVRGDTESVLSSWPAANAINAPAWLADLDGDDQPDWCVATTDGVQCGLAAEAKITDHGVGWGFSNHAAVEGSIGVDGSVDDVVHSAIADVSGDGRADMCVAIESNVECAISQGHGFGPRQVMLAMPSALPIVGLWLGDLDGDGKADACADDGTSITCALSP
jgi:LmbE family N-acetylglucosaminyl deacetylase